MINTNEVIKDRYRLVKPIGRGSFGEVWLAEDQALGINVAIKIYIALDARGLEEFKSEFKSVYNLHHPNLLRADHFDNIGNNPYLVMPYCPQSVGDLVGSIDEANLWRFIRDVASGLAYLHDNDIIHRDIKPDNILLDEQGNYVITDFGLSTKIRSTLRRASTRQMNDSHDQSGTISYMAPEMFMARPQVVKATDIWAFGATIYEVATGEAPFFGQGGVMELHGAELPELPDKYGKALQQLMVRCLAKDTWDRPTASDIARIATEHVNNLGVNTGSEDKGGASDGQAKTKKTKIALGITSIVASVFFIVILILAIEYKNCVEENYILYHKNNNLRNEVKVATDKIDAVSKFMQDTPILVNNIKVWNKGEEDKDVIYSRNTTYIYHSADLFSTNEIQNEDIFIKFITPYGLSKGSGEWASPLGYSYKQDISLTPFQVSNRIFFGWGNETKGSWSAGNYRIEYWYKDKCIGSKSFTIK